MKYIANPVVVDAWEIIGIRKYTPGGVVDGSLEVELENGQKMVVDKTMLSRIAIQPGDYYVRQEDGYVYLNPKAVFERKYRPCSVEEAKGAAA